MVGSKWTYKDLCHKPNIDPLDYFSTQLADHIIPCSIPTPLDCFYQGSQIHPQKITKLPLPNGDMYDIRYTVLRPYELVQKLRNETDFSFKPLEKYLDYVNISPSGYINKPNYMDNNISLKTMLESGHCSGISHKFQTWLKESIFDFDSATNEYAFQTTFQLMNAQTLYNFWKLSLRKFKNPNKGQHGQHTPVWTPDAAEMVLKKWQNEFRKHFASFDSKVNLKNTAFYVSYPDLTQEAHSNSLLYLTKFYNHKVAILILLSLILLVFIYNVWNIYEWDLKKNLFNETLSLSAILTLLPIGINFLTLFAFYGYTLILRFTTNTLSDLTYIIPFMLFHLNLSALLNTFYRTLFDVRIMKNLPITSDSNSVASSFPPNISVFFHSWMEHFAVLILPMLGVMCSFGMLAFIPVKVLRDISLQIVLHLVISQISLFILFPTLIRFLINFNWFINLIPSISKNEIRQTNALYQNITIQTSFNQNLSDDANDQNKQIFPDNQCKNQFLTLKSTPLLSRHNKRSKIYMFYFDLYFITEYKIIPYPTKRTDENRITQHNHNKNVYISRPITKYCIIILMVIIIFSILLTDQNGFNKKWKDFFDFIAFWRHVYFNIDTLFAWASTPVYQKRLTHFDTNSAQKVWSHDQNFIRENPLKLNNYFSVQLQQSIYIVLQYLHTNLRVSPNEETKPIAYEDMCTAYKFWLCEMRYWLINVQSSFIADFEKGSIYVTKSRNDISLAWTYDASRDGILAGMLMETIYKKCQIYQSYLSSNDGSLFFKILNKTTPSSITDIKLVDDSMQYINPLGFDYFLTTWINSEKQKSIHEINNELYFNNHASIPSWKFDIYDLSFQIPKSEKLLSWSMPLQLNHYNIKTMAGKERIENFIHDILPIHAIEINESNFVFPYEIFIMDQNFDQYKCYSTFWNWILLIVSMQLIFWGLITTFNITNQKCYQFKSFIIITGIISLLILLYGVINNFGKRSSINYYNFLTTMLVLLVCVGKLVCIISVINTIPGTNFKLKFLASVDILLIPSLFEICSISIISIYLRYSPIPFLQSMVSPLYITCIFSFLMIGLFPYICKTLFNISDENASSDLKYSKSLNLGENQNTQTRLNSNEQSKETSQNLLEIKMNVLRKPYCENQSLSNKCLILTDSKEILNNNENQIINSQLSRFPLISNEMFTNKIIINNNFYAMPNNNSQKYYPSNIKLTTHQNVGKKRNKQNVPYHISYNSLSTISEETEFSA